MKTHPLAQIIPPLTPDEIERLEASLKHGFDPMKPIVRLDGMILDGRHRYKIAERLGVQPIYEDWTPAWEGDSPAGFVARSIIHRSLSREQRATISAELLPHIQKDAEARMKAGKPDPGYKKTQGRAPRASEVAAKATGSTRQNVEAAAKIKEVSPSTFEAMKAGTISMTAAKQVLIKAPPRPVKTTPADAALATAPVFKDLRNRIHALKREIEALTQKEEGCELARVWKRIEAALEGAANDIRFNTPFKPCPIGPTCEVGCKQCKGKKWLTEQVYDLLPKELKS